MLLPLEGTWDPRLGMWGQGKRDTATRGFMGSRAGEAGDRERGLKGRRKAGGVLKGGHVRGKDK